eukprot:1156254-Pelagomonas_calceolata.AAC.3
MRDAGSVDVCSPAAHPKDLSYLGCLHPSLDPSFLSATRGRKDTSVDPYYVEEDEWNQWGKKQNVAPSDGLTPQALNKASATQPDRQQGDNFGEQHAGEGRAEDGGVQGNGSAISGVGQEVHAGKVVVQEEMGNQGAQDANAPRKGVKRKEGGVGEPKPKRGKKVEYEDFDGLND